MDNVNWNSNSSDKLQIDEEKQRLLTQLQDMFPLIPQGIIIQIAEENYWQPNICIDKIFTYDQNKDKVATERLSAINSGAVPKIVKNQTQNQTHNNSSNSRENNSSKNNNNSNRDNISNVNRQSPAVTNATQQQQQYTNWHSTQELKIGEQIRAGYRVMVLMRGAPGSGKSFLAKSLVTNYVPEPYNRDVSNYIFSTDDYFYDIKGNYRHNVNLLSTAHDYNYQRVKKNAAQGWSPIIVDNTNMQIWHMLPYVQAAVRNGYLLEILEPQTPWRHKSSQLVAMNQHGVTREVIENMLMRWESTTSEELIAKLKYDRYMVPLPQMRLQPPFTAISDISKEENTFCIDRTVAEMPSKCIDEVNITNDDHIDTKCKWIVPYTLSHRKYPQNTKTITNNIKNDEKTSDHAVYDDNLSKTLSEICNDNSLSIKDTVVHCRNDDSDECGDKNDIHKLYSPHEDVKTECNKSESNDESSPLDDYFPNRAKLRITINSIENDGESLKALNMIKDEFNKLQLHEQQASELEQSEHSYLEGDLYANMELDEIENTKGEDYILSVPLKVEDKLYNLIRFGCDIDDKATTSKELEQNTDEFQLNKFQPHAVNCPNENTSFIALRQIYSNKPIQGLWDLFVKCNGDVDWAVDILIKEEENQNYFNHTEMQEFQNNDDTFQCDCSKNGTSNGTSERICDVNIPTGLQSVQNDNVSLPDSPKNRPLPQRRSKFMRNLKRDTNRNQESQQLIENCFTIADEHYSEHVQKIRKMRHNNLTMSSMPLINLTENNEPTVRKYSNAETQTDIIDSSDRSENQYDYDDDGDIEENDTDASMDSDDSDKKYYEKNRVVLKLGQMLIKQLIELFRNEATLTDLLPETLPNNMNVFFPRSLAKRIYLLYLESIYDHAEKQMLQQKDEEFARLLKIPKYSECKESPENVQEILDMELAWDIYKEHDNKDLQLTKKQNPDMATYLTQLKLFELFPDIPQETLLDIFAAHGNCYGDTVALLTSNSFTVNGKQKKMPTKTPEQLIEYANREKELLKKEIAKRSKELERGNDLFTADGDLEEGRRTALKEFEKSRNLAAHHSQMKYECHLKAKDAALKGNGAIACYYADIAKLHSTKIELFNQMAAICIIDVHKYSHNNPDILDLHFLFIPEALECLDIFLDCHINNLRNRSHNSKEVYIITGRGRHSVGGVANIKSKVQNRLMDRKLRWQNENAGLLKVKLFSSSKYAKRKN